jgi:hypothetical protein
VAHESVVDGMPLWLAALRVINYTIIGVALVLLVWATAKMVYRAIYSKRTETRVLLTLFMFSHGLFLLFGMYSVVGLAERIAESLNFGWRDWVNPISFIFVIVYVILVYRTEDTWNPELRGTEC